MPPPRLAAPSSWLARPVPAAHHLPPRRLRGTGDLGVVIERAAGRVQIVEHSTNDQPRHRPRPRRPLPRPRHLLAGRALRLRVRARRRAHQGRPAGPPHRPAHHPGRQLHRRLHLPGRPADRRAELRARRHQGLRRRHPRTPRRGARRIRPRASSPRVGLADVSGQRFVYRLFGPARSGSPTSAIRAAPSPPATRPASSPYDGLVTPTGAISWPACSARTASRCSTCGSPSAGRSRSSPATAAANKSCRSSRCPTCAAGRWPPAGLAARHRPPRCWSPTPPAGRRPPRAGQGPAGVRDGAPDGRQVWVNFAFPDNEWVQVIDTVDKRV